MSEKYCTVVRLDTLEGLLERTVELETALTDALYAWGVAASIARDYMETSFMDTQDFQEAEARIQRARLALPKAQEATG